MTGTKKKCKFRGKMVQSPPEIASSDLTKVLLRFFPIISKISLQEPRDYPMGSLPPMPVPSRGFQ